MRRCILRFGWCLAVLGAFVSGAAAARPAPADTVLVLDRAQALVAGPGCSGSLARIAALPGRCFAPVSALAYRGTATIWHPSVNWLRFRAPETAMAGAPWLLKVSTYVTDGELAIVAPGGRVLAATRFSSETPVADRPVFSHDIRVPLPARIPADATFVVRLTSPFSVPDLLELHTAASLDAIDRDAMRDAGLPFAFLNGGALTMALFNLVLYGMLRRRIYLLYGVAISALVLFQVVETGTAWTLLWPHLGLRDDYPSYVTWVLYVGLVVAFTRTFLDLPRVARGVDLALFAMVAIVVVDSAAYVAIPDWLEMTGAYNWLDPIVTAAMVGTMLVAGAVAWRRGVSGASAYVVAFAGSAVGIVASDVAFFDPALAAYPALAYLPTSFGMAWESVFLALALGQRVLDAERNAERLSEYAYRDALTGIANRRAFDDAIEREWNRALRTNGTIAVAMFDIDNFKAFNDRYGHQTGDERLIAVARAIAPAARREGDLAARYGGEEFALLLPNTTLEAAFAIAEVVRERVAGASHEMPLTLSAGVASALAGTGATTPRALMAAADAALYSAKRAGRDRTIRWNTLLGARTQPAEGGA